MIAYLILEADAKTHVEAHRLPNTFSMYIYGNFGDGLKYRLKICFKISHYTSINLDVA